MKRTRYLLVVSSLFLGRLGAAEPAGVAGPALNPRPADPPVAAAEQPHETAIYLDIGFGVRPVPASRVTVPLGEKLRLVAPLMSEGTNYIWTKNGRAIVGAPDANVLTLDYVTSADAGSYACLFSTSTTLPRPSQTLILGVGPVERLLNLSTRALVGARPEEGLTTGFVVGGGARSKKIILRAIGPSLASFGVANGLRKPVLRIYDANGRLYENGYGYAAVVGGLTYETDLADSLQKAGAFPIPRGTDDVVEMRPFDPGTYTATVTSGDGTGGTVLLEIYEVP